MRTRIGQLLGCLTLLFTVPAVAANRVGAEPHFTYLADRTIRIIPGFLTSDTRRLRVPQVTGQAVCLKQIIYAVSC